MTVIIYNCITLPYRAVLPQFSLQIWVSFLWSQSVFQGPWLFKQALLIRRLKGSIVLGKQLQLPWLSAQLSFFALSFLSLAFWHVLTKIVSFGIWQHISLRIKQHPGKDKLSRPVKSKFMTAASDYTVCRKSNLIVELFVQQTETEFLSLSKLLYEDFLAKKN